MAAPNDASVRRVFGSLYHVIYQDLKDPAFQFLRDAFELFLLEHWRGELCGRHRLFNDETIEQHRHRGLARVARGAGVGRNRLRRMVHQDRFPASQFNPDSTRNLFTVDINLLASLIPNPDDYLDLRATARLFGFKRILGLKQDPLYILSIENQTTFHSEARRLFQENVLLLYTNGMPSPKWRAMYLRILASTAPNVRVKHWGDVDEGGFRIAAILADDAKTLGRTLEPEKMNPFHVPEDAQRPASDDTIYRMRKYAMQAGWLDLADAIQEKGITVEQEAL